MTIPYSSPLNVDHRLPAPGKARRVLAVLLSAICFPIFAVLCVVLGSLDGDWELIALLLAMGSGAPGTIAGAIVLGPFATAEDRLLSAWQGVLLICGLDALIVIVYATADANPWVLFFGLFAVVAVGVLGIVGATVGTLVSHVLTRPFMGAAKRKARARRWDCVR